MKTITDIRYGSRENSLLDLYLPAGAWITLMLAMDPSRLEKAGADRKEIAGYISDSAQITTHFNVLRERHMDIRLERVDEECPYIPLFNRLTCVAYSSGLNYKPQVRNDRFFEASWQ